VKIKLDGSIAEIWCTSDISAKELDLKVKSLRLQGYTVVVFKSGHESIADLTSELLRINN